MSNEKFESILKIMSESNFEVNENINSEYLCTICNKILINACSAHCGCRYCQKCIFDYLKNEKKTCPGDSEYCKDDMINADCDILVDQTVNIRICRLVVKCPNAGCQTKVDIKSMENHLEVCEQRSVSCPFIDVGCEDKTLKSDKVDEHLLSEIESHTKLLMDWVNYSRNETGLLKNNMKQLRSESNNLKEKMGRVEEIKEKSTSKIDILSKEMQELADENVSLKDELRHIEGEHLIQKFLNKDTLKTLTKRTEEIEKLEVKFRMKAARLDEKLKIQQENSRKIEVKFDEVSLSSSAVTMKSKEIIQCKEAIEEFIGKQSFKPLQ